MFNRLKSDRRQGYSFFGHWRRVVATKGFSRVAVSLGGAAIIAAVALGNCRSSSITSPTSGNTQGAAEGPGRSGSGDGGLTTNTWLPAAKFGPITLLVTVIPPYSPCTQQGIFWEPGKQFTTMQGYTQSSTNGSLRSQFHLVSAALGVTDVTVPATDDRWRKYVGGETYDTQERVYSTGRERYREEWNMKILAYGNRDERHDDNDFFLHVVVDIPVDPTSIPAMYAYGYCKDSDPHWWENDEHYKEDHDD
jgi:hypothetical protein